MEPLVASKWRQICSGKKGEIWEVDWDPSKEGDCFWEAAEISESCFERPPEQQNLE